MIPMRPPPKPGISGHQRLPPKENETITRIVPLTAARADGTDQNPCPRKHCQPQPQAARAPRRGFPCGEWSVKQKRQDHIPARRAENRNDMPRKSSRRKKRGRQYWLNNSIYRHEKEIYQRIIYLREDILNLPRTAFQLIDHPFNRIA